MSTLSAYQVGIWTHSADDNAVLLLAGGQLVAILVELADEGHGEERGKWVIESTFGLDHDRFPQSFSSAADAADWIGGFVGRPSLLRMEDLVKLS